MTCPRCETGNHPVAECPEFLEDQFGVPSDHEDDTTSVSLREGEARDDNTHARRTAEQLAMAEDTEDDQ